MTWPIGDKAPLVESDTSAPAAHIAIVPKGLKSFDATQTVTFSCSSFPVLGTRTAYRKASAFGSSVSKRLTN